MPDDLGKRMADCRQVALTYKRLLRMLNSDVVCMCRLDSAKSREGDHLCFPSGPAAWAFRERVIMSALHDCAYYRCNLRDRPHISYEESCRQADADQSDCCSTVAVQVTWLFALMWSKEPMQGATPRDSRHLML